MKILIIGGTGFIGKNLQIELKQHHELAIFHRGNSKIENDNKSIIGDKKDLWKYRGQFANFRPDLVVDLISYFAQDAWNLVNTFRQITKRVIIISSGDVYKAYEIFKDNLRDVTEKEIKEDDELRTKLYPYRGIDSNNDLLENYEKIMVENIIKSQNEFDWTILRLGALFGEFDNQRKLKEYIDPMLKNEKEIRVEKKKANWKWTRAYIKDVVLAIRLVIEKELESRNQIFNVGDKRAYEEIEIIDRIRKIIGWQGSIKMVENLEKESCNYSQDLILNTDKIRQKLGYKERYGFEEGLTRTIEYHKK